MPAMKASVSLWPATLALGERGLPEVAALADGDWEFQRAGGEELMRSLIRDDCAGLLAAVSGAAEFSG